MAILDLQGLNVEESTAARRSRRSRRGRCGGGSRLSLALC